MAHLNGTRLGTDGQLLEAGAVVVALLKSAHIAAQLMQELVSEFRNGLHVVLDLEIPAHGVVELQRGRPLTD